MNAIMLSRSKGHQRLTCIIFDIFSYVGYIIYEATKTKKKLIEPFNNGFNYATVNNRILFSIRFIGEQLA